MFASSVVGGSYHSEGLAVVAHATGKVSYCDDADKCVEIGQIRPVSRGDIEIHNGTSNNWDAWWVRFYIANVVDGEVTLCEVRRKDKHPLSGSCQSLGVAAK